MCAAARKNALERKSDSVLRYLDKVTDDARHNDEAVVTEAIRQDMTLKPGLTHNLTLY
jgi:hypothetical protein